MPKQKALFGRWADMQVGAINKLLKPYGVRLVKKTSKEWGGQVSLTAHPVELPPATIKAVAAAIKNAGGAAALICAHSWSVDEPQNCVRCGVSREHALS